MSKTAAQRQRESRQRKRDASAPKTVTSVTKSERDIPSVTHRKPYGLIVVEDETVYGRQAVHYQGDSFDTRPEPLDPTDQPVPMNRGRYKRDDGTVYQFDSRGKSFECKHAFTDGQGKPHLAVYETVDDVRKAGGAWT